MKVIYNKLIYYHLRTLVIIILSICLIICDKHFHYFKKVHSFLETYINSFYILTNYFQKTFNNFANLITNKNQLIFENKILKKEILLQKAKNLILEQLKKENDKLHSLLKITTNENKKLLLTTVIANNHSIYHEQIIIDKGIQDGVYEGQPVINDKGIVGQVTTASKFNSRVLLICDILHAIPIKLLRDNNVRGIAMGTGCSNKELKISMMTQSEIQLGDIIVTSGLGDRFPEGYQVGIISNIEYNIKEIKKNIFATHFINFESLDYLILFWTHKNKAFNSSINENKNK